MKSFNCSYGAKGIGNPGLFHIKRMAHAEEEEMSEDEQIKSRLPGYAAEDDLSSTNQDHERGRCHAIKGSLLERSNGKPKRHGPAIRTWWRTNPRKGRHLHIKYPQLTSRPHLCRRDP